MEPVQVSKPFDSDDFLFQIKWDGVRCLAYSSNGIRLINRHLNERTTQYPEIVDALSFMPENTVIDGEIVVPGDDGKPSFHKVMQRDLAKTPHTITKLCHTLPAVYMVFDILWYKGRNIMEKPLTERIDYLKNLIRKNNSVFCVDSVFGTGIALFDAVKNESLEGIVAKELSSPYVLGKKVPLWKKIKNWREINAIIGGYSLDESGRIRSLMVGIPVGEGLRYVGNVYSGLTQEHLTVLKKYFETKTPPPCPFINVTASKDASIRWITPEINLKIKFLEWSPDGKLRNPTVVGFGTN